MSMRAPDPALACVVLVWVVLSKNGDSQAAFNPSTQEAETEGFL